MTTIPLDGRLTSLNPLTIALTGGEVMEIVSPGNAALGDNYQVTTAALAGFFASFPAFNSTVITNGATLSIPYDAATTDTRILFNKTVSSPSYAVMPLASSMAFPFPVFFKDLKGDADTDNITITFSGGQLCDGSATIIIDVAYGFVSISPTPDGSAWYLSSN